MSEDSHKAYGKGGVGRMMSKDNGITWEPLDQNYFAQSGGALELPKGDLIQAYAPISMDVVNYKKFRNQFLVTH